MLRQVYLISNSTMRNTKITALLAVVVLFLSACGQRGALYNPAPAPTENSNANDSAAEPEQTNTNMSEGA
jgi:predicted small lipoprotein YifL